MMLPPHLSVSDNVISFAIFCQVFYIDKESNHAKTLSFNLYIFLHTWRSSRLCEMFFIIHCFTETRFYGKKYYEYIQKSCGQF
jgi:hypothetical protein